MAPSSERADLVDGLRALGWSALPVKILIGDWVGPIGIHVGRVEERAAGCSASPKGCLEVVESDSAKASVREAEPRGEGDLDITTEVAVYLKAAAKQ